MTLPRLTSHFRRKWNRFGRMIEPVNLPDKAPEEILRDSGWCDPLINTLHGRTVCLSLSVGQVKRAIWEALFL